MMNTRPLQTPFAPLPSWRGVLPSTGEFAALLNVITDAAVVVDNPSRQVVFGNRGFFELCGADPFSPNPISLDELMPDFGDGWSSGEEYETVLHFPKGLRMAAWVSVTWLDKSGKWLLLRFVPLNVHHWRNMQSRHGQELLGFMEDLSRVTTQMDLDDALELVLNIGAQMLLARGLCIYRSNMTEHLLVRVMTWGGPSAALPENLPLDVPAAVYAPSLWTTNQRAVTDLQQAARDAGLSAVVSVPIELNGNRLGVLVAVELPTQNARQMIDALEIMATYIAAALNHYLTVNNLRRTVWEHSRALATRDAIAENSREGIILLSPAMRVLDLNPAAEMMLGYATQEVAGQRVENILIGVDQLPAALRLAHQAVSSPNLGNINLHRRSGLAFPAHLQVFPVLVNNEISSIVLLIRDTSEREEIRTRTQQLEQRALLGEVTAIFAHEVRNPINNISLSLQLMEMNLPEQDPQRETVARMQNDCNRLTHLMESVLSFAKPMEYKLAPTNVGNLMERMLDRWGPRLLRLSIQSRLTVNPDLCMAMADPRALDQVFTNLVSNAINAMKDTGGVLAIKVEQIESRGSKPWISISVSDTGPGIPDEIREKIFEPFYTTSPQGTGLGLSITQRIILAHRGKIELTSFPGGTIFTVLLPGVESENP